MSSTVFTLPEIVTADTVIELHAAYSKQAEACSGIAVIDSGELTLIDLLGLQLLAVLVNELNQNSVEVVWDNLSIDLYQAADNMAMCNALQLQL